MQQIYTEESFKRLTLQSSLWCIHLGEDSSRNVTRWVTSDDTAPHSTLCYTTCPTNRMTPPAIEQEQLEAINLRQPQPQPIVSNHQTLQTVPSSWHPSLTELYTPFFLSAPPIWRHGRCFTSHDLWVNRLIQPSSRHRLLRNRRIRY